MLVHFSRWIMYSSQYLIAHIKLQEEKMRKTKRKKKTNKQKPGDQKFMNGEIINWNDIFDTQALQINLHGKYYAMRKHKRTPYKGNETFFRSKVNLVCNSTR